MTAPPTSNRPDRVRISLDAWKRKLLDLSRRNRALNFRPSPVATVRVVDEQPPEVFRQLYLLGREMRFTAAAETRGGPAPMAISEGPPNALEGELFAETAPLFGSGPDAAPFASYERSRLDRRHTDDRLQTMLEPEQLDGALRRLDELGRSSLEEQGVGTLFLTLGMLHYREADASEQVLRAPLILLPVELRRKSARTGFSVKSAEDEPIVNPALVEVLRRSFGIEAPTLPDSDTMSEEYDLQPFFSVFQQSITEQKAWSVTNDIYLAQFSFQKFVMYKDLNANGPALEAHRIVQQIVERSGSSLVGLPADIRSLNLDEEFPPEKTFQVVNADSSQIRAIAAVARGYDLVLEGPPGTGKSQTITNLIAQALAAGKSVLFVAEKMAALQVVHSRLKALGLDEFCLELHSTKAQKRLVMSEIARALDLSLSAPPTTPSSSAKLPPLRNTLTDYTKAVHAPHGALGVSPYRAYGELEEVLGAPPAPLGHDPGATTFEQLEETIRQLEDLATVVEPVGDPRLHPWRDCTRTSLSTNDVEVAVRQAKELADSVDLLTEPARVVESYLDMPPLDSFARVAQAVAVAEVLERSPGAPADVLRSEAWNSPPARAQEIVSRGKRIASRTRDLESKLGAPALERDHCEDADYVTRKAKHWSRIFAFLDGRYREIKRRWRGYRAPGYLSSLLEQVPDMRAVDHLRRERAVLAADDEFARECFGKLWQGEDSSWSTLDDYIGWVVEFRTLCVSQALSDRALSLASEPAPDLSSVARLNDVASQVRLCLTKLGESLGWPPGHLENESFGQIRERAVGIANHGHLGQRWVAFERQRQNVAGSPAASFLDPAMSGKVAFTDLPRAYRRAFWFAWLDAVVRERPELQNFHSLTHEKRIAEFRQLDQRVLEENRCALIADLRRRTQERLQQEDARACLPTLRRELTRQRGFAPLRRTLKGASVAIRAIKPCLMMSPLTVAQYLGGGDASFDLVVFDEASQLPPEDAIGSVFRGQQLVVVGDPKQLPPTNFFAVLGGQIEPIRSEDGEIVFEDSESILEVFAGSGAPGSRLRWHYRSAHESLILFSNVNFYDGELSTFPSVETDSRQRGIRFEYVETGLYEGAGMNRAEARRVVDGIVEHARTSPRLSLGVGTFSLRQQIAIQDEVERRRREDPELEDFFAAREHEPFFVKNLESIQGDERDVIFLSVTYAKAADGRLRYNFGPLNAENGWRRLNVLTTRARQHMRVYSSIHCDDIEVATPSRGAQLLRRFLAYAEHGRLEGAAPVAAAVTGSPFEAQVLAELERRGLKLVPQVGASGYRIDLGVLDDTCPGRYVCGIECDGVAYHSSETARDRDRLRQYVLEQRGWTIHRIWSTDWFRDRPGQIERILQLVEKSREDAVRRRAKEDTPTGVSPVRSPGSPSPLRMAPTQQIPNRGDLADATPMSAANPPRDAYRGPSAVLYRQASDNYGSANSDIRDATPFQLQNAVHAVVEEEGPIHVDPLVTRVAGLWGNRAGTQIAKRILDACEIEIARGRATKRGDFIWPKSGRVVIRDRRAFPMPAEHICPEEYREATLAVLRAGHGFSREDLKAEVRSLLGFSRTGHLLDEQIDRSIQGLLADGRAGEGSAGIRLRA